ncbi:MAG TPA: hypothetical protein VKV02_07420 [Acidobacteriaceae bacterium]|nr:hypothetical protein [Acidobacteriaceae bacterium]
MRLKLSFLLAGCFACGMATLSAQAPAGPPAGSSGVCNDGTYTSAPSKRGACGGHKGVKTWYLASNTTPATPATPAPATKPAPAANPAPAASPKPAPAAASRPALPATPAAGGGNGQVWVNASDNVYHCQGDRYYGKTKSGAYMSEADAKAKGARAAYGKPCSK